MITLTLFERRLRAHLLTIARSFPLDLENPAGITYRDLGVLADPAGVRASGPQPNTRPPFRGLNEALGHISMYEVEHGRPMLSALVVNAETGKPGEGFTRLAEHLGIVVDEPDEFWRAELAEVVAFWSSLANDPTRVIDAAVDSLYDELRSLREQVQRGARRPIPKGAKRLGSARPAAEVDSTTLVLPADVEDGVRDRLTDRARRALVLAQGEARMLSSSFIGTEHILLGLIHEGEGVAAKALESLGITLIAVREEVDERIGMAGSGLSGSPPFTPRAKKVLKLSLREAVQLGHSHIDTEHLLLGIVREGEGVAAQVLLSLGTEPGRVREEVIKNIT